jgi:glucosamine kinase
MIAIADSGTTKTSWLFVDKINNKKYEFKSVGFNPYYQSSENITSHVINGLIPHLPFKIDEVENIYLYGAGCELDTRKEQVAAGLRKAFTKSKINVYHDLLAAARALFGDTVGIACISGTGSNTCFYDGEKIVKNVQSLGLALGDEGAGGYKGKLLVRDYMREQMPSHIRQAFEKKYTDRTPEIMDAVYTKEFPSRYLASFTLFLAENSTDPYIQNLLHRSYSDMFNNCVTQYKNYKEVPIGYIGSVAFYFQDALKKVAAEHGATITKIIRNPLEDLAEYHFKKGI